MKNAIASILLSYFRSPMFRVALYFTLCVMALLFVTMGVIIFSTEQDPARRWAQLMYPFNERAFLMLFGVAFVFSLGSYLKSLIATSIATMLPSGRIKPLIAVYGLAFAYLTLGITIGMRPTMELHGLFAISFFSMAALLLAGFWQGRILGPMPLSFMIISKNTNIPFFAVAKGASPEFAHFYMLSAFALLGLLAYRCLTLNEERTEYKWNQIASRIRAGELVNLNQGRTWRAKLGEIFYKEKDYKGVKYHNLDFPEKFTHLVLPCMRIISVPLILSIAALCVLMSSIFETGSSSRSLTMFLYLAAFIGSSQIQQRIMFSSFESALPLSRREYIYNLGGALLITAFGIWLNIIAASMLVLVLTRPSELFHPMFFMHLILSGCLTFICFAATSLATYYAKKNAVYIMISLICLIQVAMIPFSLRGFSTPNANGYALIIIATAILGIILLRISYRKWCEADL